MLSIHVGISQYCWSNVCWLQHVLGCSLFVVEVCPTSVLGKSCPLLPVLLEMVFEHTDGFLCCVPPVHVWLYLLVFDAMLWLPVGILLMPHCQICVSWLWCHNCVGCSWVSHMLGMFLLISCSSLDWWVLGFHQFCIVPLGTSCPDLRRLEIFQSGWCTWFVSCPQHLHWFPLFSIVMYGECVDLYHLLFLLLILLPGNFVSCDLSVFHLTWGNVYLLLFLWAWAMLYRTLLWLLRAMLSLLGIQQLHDDSIWFFCCSGLHTHCSPLGLSWEDSTMLPLPVISYVLCFVWVRWVPSTILFVGSFTLGE